MGLQRTKIFTKLDLVKAYYQIPVAEEDIKKNSYYNSFWTFRIHQNAIWIT